MDQNSKPAERRRACSWCNRTLPAGRKSRRYCNATCRFQGWRKSHGIAEQACAYCGAVADTKDHVPARSIRAYIREHALGVYPELEVPCCRECNSALGAQGFTVQARRILAREAIERRYRAVLRMPHWTDAELAAMGPAVRTDIQQHALLQRWVLERLRWNR